MTEFLGPSSYDFEAGKHCVWFCYIFVQFDTGEGLEGGLEAVVSARFHGALGQCSIIAGDETYGVVGQAKDIADVRTAKEIVNPVGVADKSIAGRIEGSQLYLRV